MQNAAFRPGLKEILQVKMSKINSSSSKLCQSCIIFNAEYAMVHDIPTRMHYIIYVIGTACNILLIVLAVVLNATSIIAYWRLIRLKKKTSYFIIMLLSVNETSAFLLLCSLVTPSSFYTWFQH